MSPEDRELLRRLAVMNQAIAIVIAPWLGADLFETGLPPDALRLMADDLEGMALLLRVRADGIEGRNTLDRGTTKSLPAVPDPKENR